jgi:hypothetical protein
MPARYPVFKLIYKKDASFPEKKTHKQPYMKYSTMQGYNRQAN